MSQRKDINNVVPVPGPRFVRRRVAPPPMKRRIPIGAELRGFLDRMAGKDATR
jgi:hypothetical protein